MKHQKTAATKGPVLRTASPSPIGSWSYCANADLDYWEGAWPTSREAVAYGRDQGQEEFFVARVVMDPDGPVEDSVRLVSEPVRVAGYSRPKKTRRQP